MTENSPQSKSNILIFAFALSALEGFALLFILASARSADQNLVFAGLSAPRLALAGMLGVGSALALGATLAVWRVPLYREGLLARLDGLAARSEKLLAASFLLFLTALAAPVLAWGLMGAGGARIWERIAPVVIWVNLAGLQVLIGLVLMYRETYRSKAFFRNTPWKLMRVLVLESGDFWARVGLLLAAAGTIYAASSISTGKVVGHDSGIFLYFGQQILKGHLPFRDLWDHKPPLIFYLDALGLFVGRGSVWGVWWLEFLSLGLAGILGYAALRSRFPRWAAFIAMTAAIAHTSFFLEGGNLTEEFSLPLQWAVLLLAFVLENHRGAAWRAFISGAIFALALSLKQTMVGVWVALGIYLVLRVAIRREWNVLRWAAWAAAGAIIVIAGWVAFFASQGALSEFWNVAYVYNFLYSDITADRRLWAMGDMFTFLSQSSIYFSLVMIAWCAGIAYLVRRARQSGLASIFDGQSDLFPLAIALINLPVEFLLINASGKNYRHYFLSLLPGMSVLIAWGLANLWRIGDRVLSRRSQMQGWAALKTPALTATAAFLAVLMLWPAYFQSQMLLTASTSEVTITTTVAYIREHTNADDYVLMWGSQTTVNFLSGRQSPTRFVHQKPLFRAGFARPAYSDEMLHDLQAKRPVLIINTHLPSQTFVETTPDGICRLPDGPLPDGIDRVFTYICDHYHLEKVLTKDQWEVYRINQ